MAAYTITNTRSGTILGTYDAETEAAALDAMARDAGYADYATLEREVPSAEGEILVEADTPTATVSPMP